MRSVAHGFRAAPNAEFSFDDPIANSSQLVLPTATAPAATSFATVVASYGGTKCSRIFEEAVVRTPSVQRLSFSATGTPASGSDARFGCASTAAACARAWSRVTVLKALSVPSCASMRASASVQTSTAERAPDCTASRMSRRVANWLIR